MYYTYPLRFQTGNKQVMEKQTVARSGIVEVSAQFFLLSCPASELILPHQFPGPQTPTPPKPSSTHTHTHITYTIPNCTMQSRQASRGCSITISKQRLRSAGGWPGAAVEAQTLTEEAPCSPPLAVSSVWKSMHFLLPQALLKKIPRGLPLDVHFNVTFGKRIKVNLSAFTKVW